jgi:hypothetical protein
VYNVCSCSCCRSKYKDGKAHIEDGKVEFEDMHGCQTLTQCATDMSNFHRDTLSRLNIWTTSTVSWNSPLDVLKQIRFQWCWVHVI